VLVAAERPLHLFQAVDQPLAYILPRRRVHWVDASFTEAVAVITHWGAGTSKLLKAMR
jgi:hypothetical protein